MEFLIHVKWVNVEKFIRKIVKKKNNDMITDILNWGVATIDAILSFLMI